MNNPFETMKVVPIAVKYEGNRNYLDLDAMLDVSESETSLLDQYKAKRDFDLLRFKEGATPDVFYIQRLPRRYNVGMTNNGFSLSTNIVSAFMTGVHHIECSDGTVMDAELTKERIKGTNVTVTIAKEEWYDEVCDKFGHDVILEMGQLVIDFAGLPKNQHGPFSCLVSTVQKL